MQKLEFRTQHIDIVATDENMQIEGIVNPIGARSRDLGGFKEIINQGVFTKAIQKATDEDRDIFLYYNHDSNNVMASLRSNTLELVEQEDGLLMRATLPKTTLNKDVFELMKSGVIREMSFGFSGAKSEWSYDNEEKLKIRTITDLDLWEVSVVGMGAYKNTKANTRSLEDVLEEAKELQEQSEDTQTNEIEEEPPVIEEEKLNDDTEARAKAVAILECLKLRG